MFLVLNIKSSFMFENCSKCKLSAYVKSYRILKPEYHNDFQEAQTI